MSALWKLRTFCVNDLALDHHIRLWYWQERVRELNCFPGKSLVCVLKFGLFILICLFPWHMDIFQKKSQYLNLKSFQSLLLTQ